MEKGGFLTQWENQGGGLQPAWLFIASIWIMVQSATLNYGAGSNHQFRAINFSNRQTALFRWGVRTQNFKRVLIFFHRRIFFKLWLPHSLNMAWHYWLMLETTCWKVAAWYLCHLSLGPMTINVVDLAPTTQAFGLQGTHHNLVQIVLFFNSSILMRLNMSHHYCILGCPHWLVLLISTKRLS